MARAMTDDEFVKMTSRFAPRVPKRYRLDTKKIKTLDDVIAVLGGLMIEIDEDNPAAKSLSYFLEEVNDVG